MFGNIKITNFGKRHFDSKFSGTKITDNTVEEFETVVNDCANAILNKFASFSSKGKLYNLEDKANMIGGYAPFCKIITIPNFTNARVGSLPINISNYQYLRSGYSARTSKELPVLSRWFELPLSPPVADFLVVIVYSKEQLKKEYDAILNPTEPFDLGDNDAWGVVAILGQTHPGEEPMQPITMMRNALGVEEGGSGVVLDKEKYKISVEFWSQNAIVKS